MRNNNGNGNNDNWDFLGDMNFSFQDNFPSQENDGIGYQEESDLTESRLAPRKRKGEFDDPLTTGTKKRKTSENTQQLTEVRLPSDEIYLNQHDALLLPEVEEDYRLFDTFDDITQQRNDGNPTPDDSTSFDIDFPFLDSLPNQLLSDKLRNPPAHDYQEKNTPLTTTNQINYPDLLVFNAVQTLLSSNSLIPDNFSRREPEQVSSRELINLVHTNQERDTPTDTRTQRNLASNTPNNANLFTDHTQASKEELKTELRQKDFSDNQIERIARKDTADFKTITSILNNYNALTMNPPDGCGFNRQQITRITSRFGGSHNLEAALDLHLALTDKKLKFTNQDIVTMASHAGGSHNLEAALDLHSTLTDKKFTNNDIVTMARHNGGSHNLKTALALHLALTDKKFTNNDIVKMARHAGGSHNLEAALDLHLALTDKKLKFTNQDIVTMASHAGGCHNLEAALDLHSALTDKKFTNNDIVTMACHNGGSCNLKAALALHSALTDKKFTNNDIVTMANYIGGSCNLVAVFVLYSQLHEKRVTNQTIINIVRQNGGSLALIELNQHYKTLLTTHKYTPNRIWNLFSSNRKPRMQDMNKLNLKKADKNTLGNLYKEKYSSLLSQKQYTQTQIDEILKGEKGKRGKVDFISAILIIKFHDTFIQKGFNCEQIKKMCKHPYAVVYCEQIINRYESLSLHYSNDQIVEKLMDGTLKERMDNVAYRQERSVENRSESETVWSPSFFQTNRQQTGAMEKTPDRETTDFDLEIDELISHPGVN